jgi:hypothetical protein
MRISAVEKLPNPIRLEIEKRIRAGESRASIALWATGEGHPLTERAVRVHAEKINDRISKAKESAEQIVAVTEAIETSGIRTDLLTLSQNYLHMAMMSVGPDYFQSLRPAEMLAASSRLMAVEVQVQRLKEELRAKAAIEIKNLEGELDISNEMLIQIRQRIYGIFD